MNITIHFDSGDQVTVKSDDIVLFNDRIGVVDVNDAVDKCEHGKYLIDMRHVTYMHKA